MDHTPRHNQLFHFFTLRSVLPTSSSTRSHHPSASRNSSIAVPQWAGWLVALALTFALYALYHHAPSALFGPTSDVDAGDGAVDEPGTSDNHDQAAGDTFSQTQFLAWMAAQANAAPAWPAEWAKLDALLWGQGLEGHMEAEQAHYYAAVGRLPFVRTVCEIGFNAGHSATVWLTSQPGLLLQSFDIGLHDYVDTVAHHIKAQFPGRFDLALGDSVQAVPDFAERNPGFVCDVLRVDGGHFGEVPRLDLVNMRALAGPHSILLMDDLRCGLGHCQATQRAWDELKAVKPDVEGLEAQAGLAGEPHGGRVARVEPDFAHGAHEGQPPDGGVVVGLLGEHVAFAHATDQRVELGPLGRPRRCRMGMRVHTLCYGTQ